jgi:methylase of polypeptide subunit release factors
VGLVVLLRRASGRLSQSRAVARRLFRIDFPPRDDPDARYFDLTTPVLVSMLAPRLRPHMRLLDMGTGAFATIGLALWRRTGCDVVATDVRPELVRKAQANVDANRAPIRVVEARFFDGVEGDFDCVAFNAPYVPSRFLSRSDPQSDGGPDGTSVIEGFLDSFAAKGGDATAYLGVNRWFVPRERVVPLVVRRAGLELAGVRRRWPWPVDVYVLTRIVKT